MITTGALATITTVTPTIAGIPKLSSSSAGSTLDPVTNASTYFTRITGGTGGTTINWGSSSAYTPVTYTGTAWQFNINGIFTPNYQPTFDQAIGNLLCSYGLSDSVDGGGHPLMNSLAAWNSGFGHVEARFCSGDGVTVISGVDCRGNMAQGSFYTAGTAITGTTVGGGAASLPTNLLFLVFAQTTSSLIVGAGRQLQVVL